MKGKKEREGKREGKGREGKKGRDGRRRRTEERGGGGASARLDRPTDRSTEGRKELRWGC